MKNQITWFIVAVMYIAVLFILVKPGSKGTVIIGNIFSTFTDLVRGVAGQTYDSKTSTWSVANG